MEIDDFYHLNVSDNIEMNSHPTFQTFNMEEDIDHYQPSGHDMCLGLRTFVLHTRLRVNNELECENKDDDFDLSI